MFWLSYECFSILSNAFLLKRVISSHNSWQIFLLGKENLTSSDFDDSNHFDECWTSIKIKINVSVKLKQKWSRNIDYS